MIAPSLGDYFRQRENNFNFIRLLALLLAIYGHSYAVVKAGGADLFTRLHRVVYLYGCRVQQCVLLLTQTWKPGVTLCIPVLSR